MKPFGNWIDPRIASVRVDDVRNYMLRHGWELQAYPNPKVLVFGGPKDDDNKPIIQVLPSSEKLGDYEIRLEELIRSLSIMEQRTTFEILDELLNEHPRNGKQRRNDDPEVARLSERVSNLEAELKTLTELVRKKKTVSKR
jgi:hypothetical protein